MTDQKIQTIKKYREYDLFRHENMYYAISSEKLNGIMPEPDLLHKLSTYHAPHHLNFLLDIIDRKYPQQVRIDIANNCNIRCLMCEGFTSYSKSDLQFIKLDTIKPFFEKIRNRPVKDIYIGCHAEPLINPEFADIAQWLRYTYPDSKIWIVTNGVLLHKYVGLFNQLKLYLQLSLDSLVSETYRFIRNGAMLGKLIYSLERLHSNCQVNCHQVLMQCNADECDRIIEFCHTRGYTFSCVPMSIGGHASMIRKEILDQSLWFAKEQLIRTAEVLSSKLRHSKTLNYEVITEKRDFKERANECISHYFDFTISGNGNCLLCQRFSVGNLFFDTPDQILEKYENLCSKIGKNRKKYCMGCPTLTVCYSPSIVSIESYFKGNILSSFQSEDLVQFGLSSDLTDSQRKEYFIKTIGSGYIICDVKPNQDGYQINVYNNEKFAERLRNKRFKYSHEAYKYAVDNAEFAQQPVLVERFGDYNIVHVGYYYYAVPLSIGHIDMAIVENQERPEMLHANSIVELKQLLPTPPPHIPAPSLVETDGLYNFVEFGGKFFAVPIILGPMDMRLSENQQKIGVLTAESIAELKKMVDYIKRGLGK